MSLFTHTSYSVCAVSFSSVVVDDINDFFFGFVSYFSALDKSQIFAPRSRTHVITSALTSFCSFLCFSKKTHKNCYKDCLVELFSFSSARSSHKSVNNPCEAINSFLGAFSCLKLKRFYVRMSD